MKTLYIFPIVAVLVGCGPSAEQITTTAEAARALTQTAAPTFTPTNTPTLTPSWTPTLEFTDVYESESIGVSVRHPTGWDVSEEENGITIEGDNNQIEIYFFPKTFEEEYNGNPIAALTFVVQAVGYVMPDKERLHIIELNNSAYAFGSYLTPGEWVGFYHPSPQFIALHFTEEYTIITIFHAPDNDNEQENRLIFETALVSLPPSIPLNIIPAPTLVPNVSIELPELPNGFNWQGVENLDLALPVPDGWFVTVTKNYETWQGGLQEYDYQFLITQENPNLVGSFSPYIGSMTLWTFKIDSEDAGEAALEFSSDLESNPAITIVDKHFSERGNFVSYLYLIHGINSDADQDDPNHNRTARFAILANRRTNTFYFLNFESASEAWDQEWETGQVMMEMLLDFLQS